MESESTPFPVSPKVETHYKKLLPPWGKAGKGVTNILEKVFILDS